MRIIYIVYALVILVGECRLWANNKYIKAIAEGGANILFSSIYMASVCEGYNLNSVKAWCSRIKDVNQWIAIYLPDHKIADWTEILIQGRNSGNQFVKTFRISYTAGEVGEIWKDYENQKVLTGNSDMNTIVTVTLDPPINARGIRIHPLTWNNHISLRLEAHYGYMIRSFVELGEGMTGYKDVIMKLGEGVRLPTTSYRGFIDGSAAIYVSSRYWSGCNGYKINDGEGWCAAVVNQNQWMEIRMNNIVCWIGLDIQGRGNYAQWVTRFTITYSLDPAIWLNYENLPSFIANTDINTVRHILLEPYVNALAIRIHPLFWNGHPSMRIEAYYRKYN